MKNRKGFTLVELLATIAILGILATIAGISITGVMSKAKTDTNKIQENMINEAVKAYVLDHRKEFKETPVKLISTSDLSDYIDGNISEIVSDTIIVSTNNGKVENINKCENNACDDENIYKTTALEYAGLYIKEKYGTRIKNVASSSSYYSGAYWCEISASEIVEMYNNDYLKEKKFIRYKYETSTPSEAGNYIEVRFISVDRDSFRCSNFFKKNKYIILK